MQSIEIYLLDYHLSHTIRLLFAIDIQITYAKTYIQTQKYTGVGVLIYSTSVLYVGLKYYILICMTPVQLRGHEWYCDGWVLALLINVPKSPACFTSLYLRWWWWWWVTVYCWLVVDPRPCSSLYQPPLPLRIPMVSLSPPQFQPPL